MSTNNSFINKIIAHILKQINTPSYNYHTNKHTTQPHHIKLNKSILTKKILSKQLNSTSNINITRHTILTPSTLNYLKHQHISYQHQTTKYTINTTPHTRHQTIILDTPSSPTTLITNN